MVTMHPSSPVSSLWALSALALLAAGLLSLVGCGDLTAGGAAESEVSVVGDAPTAQAVGAAQQSLLPSSLFEGTVAVRLRVLLLTSSGDTTMISGGDREVEVDIRGEVPASLGAVSVPPGAYEAVRLVFTRIEADVTSGLVDPLLLAGGPVVVDLGASGVLTVERDLPVLLEADDLLEVTVVLGAQGWIAAVANLPPPRIVTPAAFESFLQVDARVR